MSRILLVEDDPDVLLLFEEVLVEAGYQVDTAATCREASNQLALRNYDLLLSDGRLPDGTGITLADIAKAKRIPALIVTGYTIWLDERHPKARHQCVQGAAQTGDPAGVAGEGWRCDQRPLGVEAA